MFFNVGALSGLPFAKLDTIAPQAAVHHHVDARFPRAPRGGFVDHAVLQPQVFDAQPDAAFDDGRHMHRRAEHVHDVGPFGQAFQIRIGFLAQHLVNPRSNGDDAITQALQSLCDTEARARRIGRQPDYRDVACTVQQLADFSGAGIGKWHDRVLRCGAAIINHRHTN